MACTDVAKVEAKATAINLIILSSNMTLQDFRAAITAFGRSDNIISSLTTRVDQMTQRLSICWAAAQPPLPSNAGSLAKLLANRLASSIVSSDPERRPLASTTLNPGLQASVARIPRSERKPLEELHKERAPTE